MAKATTRPIVRIHDMETNEITDREMNDAELEAYEADRALQIEFEAKRVADAEAKAALLARLGLTEDELKTILG